MAAFIVAISVTKTLYCLFDMKHHIFVAYFTSVIIAFVQTTHLAFYQC